MQPLHERSASQVNARPSDLTPAIPKDSFRYSGGFVALESLSPSDEIVLLGSRSAGLTIRNAGFLTLDEYRVSKEQLTALVLTELCFEHRVGRVCTAFSCLFT
jgi:hypothetical protein